MAVKLIIGINDLNTVNPLLSAQWNHEKNGELKPINVSAGSSKKVWWRCACGNEWQATIASRNSGVGCPVCARNANAKKIHETLLEKNGSLAERNPELAMEWDHEKNKLTPEQVTPNSHEKVWWLCNLGHSWEDDIKARNNGKVCPICSKTKHTSERKNTNKTIRLLKDEKPELLNEWDYEKNVDIDVMEVSYGSHKKVWWRCKNGHSWSTTVNHRTSKTRGCPFCAPNPQLLPGENDLETLYPNIAKEWHPRKNGELLPNGITSKNNKPVWWKCSKGHEWKTSPLHRVLDKSGCPNCSSGKQTSFPEQAVFYYVKKSYTDAINGFTDIFSNHGMELDIYIPSLKIGIEYDGFAFHRTKVQKEREEKKFEVCKANGIKLIRLREDEETQEESFSDLVISVNNNLTKAICELRRYLPLINDVDVEQDALAIESNYRSSLQKNSLASVHPNLITEWNYEKNEGMTPDMFQRRSNKQVWWKCSLGHEWIAKIDARVRGTGCPYCNNHKVLYGFNDLMTKRPDLIDEWDYKKNIDLDPKLLLPGSGKRAWWICKQGHSWMAEISSRNKGSGCPYCAGNRTWQE